MSFAQPQIPDHLLHKMREIASGGGYDASKGGQWIPDKKGARLFRGAVLPLNNEDLQYTQGGTFTVNAQKLYTNGKALGVGAQVMDLFDRQTYTVKQELTHGPLHPMKRYIVERKGVSSPK